MSRRHFATHTPALRGLHWASLALVVALILPPGAILAAWPGGLTSLPSASIAVTPASATFGVGLTQTFDLTIDGVSGLYAAEITLTYDPTLVAVEDAQPAVAGVQIEPGPLFPPSQSFVIRNQVDPATGQISFMVSLTTTGGGLPNGGTLARVTLRGLRAASGTLHIAQGLLCNALAVSIDAALYDGALHVVSATPTVTRTGSPTVPPSVVPASPTPTPTATPTDLLTIFCQPGGQTLPPGTVGSFDVVVTNATDLVGLTLQLSFHPGTIMLQQATLGDFFASPYWHQTSNQIDPVAGILHFEGLLTTGTRSGTGTLLHVVFTTLVPGVSPLSFSNTAVVQPGGLALYPVLVHGQVVVSGTAPTSTPSLTPSRTPSRTPTATATATLGPSPTPTTTASATPPVGVTPQHLVLQDGVDGYAGTADSYLHGDYPNSNYGNYGDLQIRSVGARRPVIRFDLSQIPTGSTVTRAQLQLRSNYYRSGTSPMTVEVYGLRRPWVESQVTWVVASTGQPWAQGGADNTTTDRDPAPVASTAVENTDTWYTWDITPLAQGWVSDPAANYGLLLYGRGTPVEYRFWSSELSSVSLHPRLIIDYLPAAAATATPTALPTATATLTPTSGATPTPTATETPGPTPTPSPTGGPTPVTVTLQEGILGYTGVADTYIDAWNVDRNRANDVVLIVRQGGARKGLVYFDLSCIPAGSSVTSATLSLYSSGRSNSNAMTLLAYRVLRAWSEGQATWNQASDGQFWGLPGCSDTSTDRSGTPSGSVTVSAVGAWVHMDITSLVQQWVSAPAGNRGLVLEGSGVTSVEYSFASSEQWWRLDQGPKLSVSYHPPGP